MLHLRPCGELSTPRLRAGIALASALALATLGSTVVHAQPASSDEAMADGMTEERDLADEQARLHYRAGRSLYDAGQFAQAAAQFEEAYRLSQRPELLFNAYVAYREVPDLEGAYRMLSAYLEEAQQVRDRVNLEARLASMEQALDEQRRQQEALDRAQQERLTREQERRQQEREQRQADAPPAQPPPQTSDDPVWPWIMVGIGGMALVGGIITGGLALAQADSLALD